MKKIFLTLFLTLGTIVIQGQEIKWMTFDEAITLQKKNKKPIFMDVYTDWCGPCKMLDKDTFHDPKIVEYINQNYNPVKFNAEGTSSITFEGVTYTNPKHDANRTGRNSAHEFTTFLKVSGYPSMFIIDKKGTIKQPIVGLYKAKDLLPLIKIVE